MKRNIEICKTCSNNIDLTNRLKIDGDNIHFYIDIDSITSKYGKTCCKLKYIEELYSPISQDLIVSVILNEPANCNRKMERIVLGQSE